MSKELEAFNKIISGGCKGKYHKYCEIVETALKALQIIKKKIYSVRNDGGMICDKSNIHYQVVVNQLTQEEIDLLKEVLL